MHEASRMAWQNHQALDWILAEKGGVLLNVWRTILHLHT